MNSLNKEYNWFYLIFLVMVIFSGCQFESEERVEEIHPTLRSNLVRFEEALQSIDTSDITNELGRIDDLAPHFSNLYFTQLLNIPRDTEREEIVLEMLKDTGYQNLYKEVGLRFGDFNDIENEVNQALENYLQLFQLPEDKVPNVYTFLSGFMYQSLIFSEGDRDGIAIGLDMFLGAEFPYKRMIPDDPLFSDYLTRSYNRDHISKKVVEVIVEDLIGSPSGGDFLSLMIWGGKKLYIMDQILDFKVDTVVTEYSKDQLEWCRENEVEMWNFFFEKDLFYKTDIREFSKLVGKAPTSPGMPLESPGGTANYIGWQIVRAYMNRNPKVGIVDLLNIDDAQAILDGSKYKPSI